MALVDYRYALALRERRKRERQHYNAVIVADWFNTPVEEGGAREKQKPPEDDDWRFWLALAGRGWGKTRLIVEWAKKQAHEMPGSRGMVVAATAADARDILVEGESGFLNTSTDVTYWPGKSQLQWDNGSIALIRSAEQPDRLRGPQQHWAIADELAAWKYAQETWDMLMFGLRLGLQPRVAIATTPRPTPIIRALVKDPLTRVTKGSTFENRDNLAPAFLDAILKKYKGTRLGRQEIEAEILDDIPGAMWTRANIDKNRIRHTPEHLSRVVVAFDPPASETEDSAEAGIVVCAKGKDGHGYVLDDVSMRGTVDERLDAIVGAYKRWRADRIIVERNSGGDWIPHAIKGKDPSCAVATVWASRGKQTRAEPVAAKYEQDKVHHVGTLPELEDQLCITADTLITTERGDIRIDRLMLSDKVLTRDGYRSIRWVGMTNPAAKVAYITTNWGGYLLATVGHPVYTKNRGFVRMIDLCSDDILEELCPPKSLTMAESFLSMASIIETPLLANYCTASNGSWNKDPSRQDGMSTTKMMTSSITPSTISNVSAIPNMPRDTYTELRYGTLSDAVKIPRQYGREKSPKSLCVMGAEQNSSAPVHEQSGVARNVVEGFITQKSVLSSSTRPVYNLSVDGTPEYYANGILTHNCTWVPDDASPDRLDALVWGLTDLLLGNEQSVKKVHDSVNLYGSRDRANDKYAGRGGGRRRRRQ